ncbi:hypothetical protein [Hyphobacterium marinum]|uniref:17 kDa surface antigen n=1 Tax=Hyphobacterium marinum TaxID=3116574 RepID=A0ABU7M121_9PROT|nr:hypothetical protein [Hyphobacterium sp. Y6023]MEE2567391.1 hypothetical protein [Hyphobacterium sp. Y6023]
MTLLRATLLAAASTMILVPAAEAQHSYSSQDCESQRQGRQVAGAIVGAILGGVIGAEIEDSIDDRDNHRGRYGRGRHRGGRHYRGRDRGNENDLAVAAGAGIGALVGAGVAGGNPCAPARNPHYDSGYYGDPYDGKPAGYNDAYYGDAGYGYDDGYDGYGYENDAYVRDYDPNTLAGGPEGYTYTQPDYTGDARVYTATSVTGNCRWMQSRSQNSYGQVTTNDVYMCQGSDGIWRPAQ